MSAVHIHVYLHILMTLVIGDPRQIGTAGLKTQFVAHGHSVISVL